MHQAKNFIVKLGLKISFTSLSLDNADGWIELVNYSEANKKDIVINSAARSGEAVEKFGGTLIGSLEELNRKLISFWVINRQRDSIELLKKYMDVVPGELHVVRNTFYPECKMTANDKNGKPAFKK